MTTKLPRSVKKTNRINMIALIVLHLTKNRTMDLPGYISIHFFGGEKAPIINLNVGRAMERLSIIFGRP